MFLAFVFKLRKPGDCSKTERFTSLLNQKTTSHCKCNSYCNRNVNFNINLLLASFARSVRQVMDRVFSFLLWPKREARGPWKQGRKKRGSITCCTDRADEANKMFIIWLCWLFRFWKGDRELEVRTATYGPGIDQSQHAKSVSHIINVCT